MELLSVEEARAINEARTLMQGIAARFERAAVDVIIDREAKATERHMAFSYGKCVAAVTVAQDALFDVINTITSHTPVELPDEVIHNRERKVAA